MEMSLRGISSLPAAQYSGVGDSVESVLQWISFLQEEWLIVFDNADDPSPEVVEKFIPSGNRGNILITAETDLWEGFYHLKMELRSKKWRSQML